MRTTRFVSRASGPACWAGRWPTTALDVCSPSDDTGFRIRVPADPGAEDRPEPDALRPDQHVPRGPAGRRWRGRSSSAPGTSTSASARRRGTWCSPTPRATSSASSSRATTSWPTADSSARSSCDGSQEVGYFWSEALGWPLVWDQDEETAIQSPRGGPKITWGGPPVAPKTGKNRLHFDLAPPADGDQQAEVDRLVSLGATRVDIGQGDVSWVVMADPDGNEFCVAPDEPEPHSRCRGRSQDLMTAGGSLGSSPHSGRRGRHGQEIAAFTSSTTFFSTAGLHFWSAYDTGHRSPSSRLAASWKPRVEYR